MGKKGDKLTNQSNESAEELLEMLSTISGISSKKMFGGNGIFHEGKMFGIVDSKGGRFIKANEETKSDYEAKGSEKHSRMPYYSIPEDILGDKKLLLKWVKKSIEISKN